MSLRDQFAPDLSRIFINLKEHGTTREFRIANGAGGFRVFRAPVVWDTELVKQMPVVKVHGVYMGDVICYIEHKYLPRMPLAGELIYSPANVPWEVLDLTDEEFCYRMALYATRSQPGSLPAISYGRN